MLGTWLTVFACSFGSVQETKNAGKYAGNDGVSEATIGRRALVEPQKVIVPKGTHTVVPADMGGDYNVYPADNAVVMQGIASGPIGTHKSGMFWVTGVHAHDVEDGPSHLEAVLVYPVECDHCPGEEVSTVRIESAKSTEGRTAELLRVRSLELADLDDDGAVEVILDVRFRPCCEGDEKRLHYTEIIVLKVEGEKITRWRKGEMIARGR